MTSSASTGRCPSSMSTSPTTSGSRADPGSACSGLDTQPSQVVRERSRRLERLPVVVPPDGRPDLCVVERADDCCLALQPGGLPQVGRKDEATLGVELDLYGARKDEPAEGPGSRVLDDRQRRYLAREALPSIPRPDRQAEIQPARNDRAAGKLRPELRRHGKPSLRVHRVPVLAGEHLPRLPVFVSAVRGPRARGSDDAWPGAPGGSRVPFVRRRDSPLVPTSWD